MTPTAVTGGQSSSSATSVTSASATIPAGSVLVAYFAAATAQAANPTISDSLGLVWTLRQPSSPGTTGPYVWTAPAIAGSTTITVNYGTASASDVVVEIWPNASGVGATAFNNFGYSGSVKTPSSVSLTTTGANSQVSAAINSNGNLTLESANWTVTAQIHVIGLSVNSGASPQIANSGTVATATWDAGGGFYGATAAAAVEILPTATGGTVTGSGALSGSGSLTASASPSIPAAASLSGAGTLSAAASPSLPATANLSGVGNLTVGASPDVGVAVLLSGTGTLTASSLPQLVVVAALSGDGVLEAVGLVIAVNQPGSVAITVTATGKAALSFAAGRADITTAATGKVTITIS